MVDDIEARYAALGRLAAGVAHDINNHLTVAELTLSSLARGLTDGAMRVDLAHVQRAIDGIAKIAEQLLKQAHGIERAEGK